MITNQMGNSQGTVDPRLEDMVTCAICTSKFSQPKHLSCQHTFCAGCLKQWMESPQNIATPTKLPCPTCRCITDLGSAGVHGLPTDFNKNTLLETLGFSVNAPSPSSQVQSVISQCTLCRPRGIYQSAVAYCDDCSQSMCGACLLPHKTEAALSCHYCYNFVAGRLPDIFCHQHEGKKQDCFCQRCSKCVCSICVQVAHQGHGATTLEFAHDQKRAAVDNLLQQLDEKLGKLEMIEHEKSAIEANFSQIKEDIKQHANTAKSHINTWQQLTLKDLENRLDECRGNIKQREEQVNRLEQLKSNYKDHLQPLRPREFLKSFNTIITLANNYLELSSPGAVKECKFVPLTLPDRIGYVESTDSEIQEGAAASRYPSIPRLPASPMKALPTLMSLKFQEFSKEKPTTKSSEKQVTHRRPRSKKSSTSRDLSGTRTASRAASVASPAELAARAIRFTGVAEGTKNEMQTILALLSKLEITPKINENDIEMVYRVGKKPPGDAPRVLYVQFTNRSTKKSIYEQKATFCQSNPGLFMHEQLTEEKRVLYNKAKGLVRDKVLHSAWTDDGEVYARASKTSSAFIFK